MLFVSGMEDDRYLITDNSDGITESVSKKELLDIIKLGLAIHGVSTYAGKVSVQRYNPKNILASLKLQGVADIFSLDLMNNEILIHHYKGNEANVKIPYGVVHIGISCFDENSDLESVKLPDTVEYLRGHCFSDCLLLSSVKLSNSLKRMGDYCFYNCGSLKSIDIPSSVLSLGDNCFEDCDSLESVDIPSLVKKVGIDCFKGCDSLEYIKVPYRFRGKTNSWGINETCRIEYY